MGNLTRILVVGAVLLLGVVVGVSALASSGGPDPGPLDPIVVVDPDGVTGSPGTGIPSSKPTARPTQRPSAKPTRSATPDNRPTRGGVPVVPPKPTRVDDDDDEDDRGRENDDDSGDDRGGDDGGGDDDD